MREWEFFFDIVIAYIEYMNIFRMALLFTSFSIAASAVAASKSKTAPAQQSATNVASEPAAPAVEKQETSEMKWDRRIGLQLAFLYPSPGGFGGGLNYRINDDFRVGIGYGTIIFFETYGVNARYLFARDWAVRPFLGLQLNRTETIWDEIIDSVLGVPASQHKNVSLYHAGVDVGFDFLAGNGFNIGAGAAFLIVGAKKTEMELDSYIWPFGYLGWYF